MGEVVGAVDLGSGEVRVLIGQRNGDGVIQVTGYGVAASNGSISQGVVRDRNAVQAALKRALADAEKGARTKVDSLFCGVNGKNVETFIREGQVHIDREIIEERHMHEARDIASREILAVGQDITSNLSSLEWYVDDMRVTDPLGMWGQILKTRVHFARLPAVIRDNIRACIESQHRELEGLIFTPLAASLGCLTSEDVELGAAVIDLGRSCTGVAVHRDDRVLGTHCFRLGAYHITRDVAAGLRVGFEEADDLIFEYGISPEYIRNRYAPKHEGSVVEEADADRPARIKLRTAVPGAPGIVDRKKLDRIIFLRTNELLDSVRKWLEAARLEKELVRGVVLTGGASRIKNFPMLAEAVFQVPCRVGFPNSIEIRPHAVEEPQYSAAVGIVRHGFEHRTAEADGQHGRRRKGPLAWFWRLLDALRRWFL